MTEHDDKENNDQAPWWSAEASEDTPLPKGYPERPDAKKLTSLRDDLHRDRMARLAAQQNTRVEKYAAKVGKSAKDIGTYTLIPAMMIAGPAVGYGLGWLVEWKWGGAPWPGVVGLLVGLAAAFRQIFLILARKTAPDKENQPR